MDHLSVRKPDAKLQFGKTVIPSLSYIILTQVKTYSYQTSCNSYCSINISKSQSQHRIIIFFFFNCYLRNISTTSGPHGRTATSLLTQLNGSSFRIQYCTQYFFPYILITCLYIVYIICYEFGVEYSELYQKYLNLPQIYKCNYNKSTCLTIQTRESE